MKTIHLLLGCAERRVSSVVEASVLDACYNIAAVKTTRAMTLGDFVRQGCLGKFELVILAKDCLVPEARQRGGSAAPNNCLEALHRIKSCHGTPVIVLSGAGTAGAEISSADVVLPELFDRDELKNAVRNLLRLPEAVEEEPTENWSWLAQLVRGLQRVKRA